MITSKDIIIAMNEVRNDSIISSAARSLKFYLDKGECDINDFKLARACLVMEGFEVEAPCNYCGKMRAIARNAENKHICADCYRKTVRFPQ